MTMTTTMTMARGIGNGNDDGIDIGTLLTMTSWKDGTDGPQKERNGMPLKDLNNEYNE